MTIVKHALRAIDRVESEDVALKCKCGGIPRAPHPCPFQYQVNDDDETECNCCEQCTDECEDNI